MQGKILSLTVIFLMVIGSFGAVSSKIVKEIEETCNCETFSDEINVDELCKFVVPDNWWEDAKFDLIEPKLSLPSSFDWRDNGGVTPVKNQGSCGSCWAFGTVAPLEAAIKIEEGKTVDLSEQWLVSCNKDGWGCNGGWWAHDYHEWKKGSCGGTGAVLESDFPYRASDKPCNGPYDHPYLLENWAFIGSEHGVPQRDAIKQAIMDYGPVSAAVRATNDWSSYSGGVYNNDASGRVNHAITLVGWDDSMGSKGVWILKNSWGTGWGDNGYMYIEYGCSSVGYSACYVDGYRGPPQENEEEVILRIQEITNDPGRGNFDEIDTILDISRGGIKPEWYYRVGATVSGENEYQKSYNIDPEGWWVFEWISEHTWKPKEDHRFITESKTIDFTIKLMDDDVVSGDDLADVSAKSGGGKDDSTSDKRAAIFHGTYNLISDELTGDSTSTDGGYYTTKGDGANNAKVWFKLTDSYDGGSYEPDLDVSPNKIDFGEKEDGSPSDSFTIKNLADFDENGWQKLEWTATDDKDWISLDKTSGSLNGQASDVVTVTADASDLSKGTHTGTISVSSNGGSEEVEVEITIKGKGKSVNRLPLWNLIKDISPIFRNLLLKLSSLYF